MRRAVSLALTAAAVLAGVAGVGALTARGDGEAKQDVSNMDVDFLRESLLKLWIIEYTSSNYNQSKIAKFSFEGLNPGVPTGDAELDAKNEAARKKTSKDLRHYLLLELDGSIEAVDIVDRVLGTKVVLSPAEAERRRFFTAALPAISWKNRLLQDALQDISRLTGTPVELHPVIPKNLTLEISFDAPAGFNVQNVLEYINSIHPVEWKYDGGKLDVNYLGDIPKNPYGR